MTAPTAPLPELSTELRDQMETSIFDRIEQDVRTRRARRARRTWWTASVAAAIVLVAAIAVPAALRAGTDTVLGGAAPATEEAGSMLAENDSAGATGASADAAAGREVITTSTATVRVESPGTAVTEIGRRAQESGGYVEATRRDDDAEPTNPDQMDTMIYPAPQEGTWIRVRVPTDQVDAFLSDLNDLGTVTSSSLSSDDVTAELVDVRARLDSARASVARLTDLMAKAESIDDLLAAENSLAERQAMVESYEQQLEYMEKQVALATVTVSLLADDAPTADASGFGAGLAAGWKGLVASLNAIVVALGFALPWLVILAVIALGALGVRALVRRRRAGNDDTSAGA